MLSTYNIVVTYLHEGIGKVLATPITESSFHWTEVLSSLLAAVIFIILTNTHREGKKNNNFTCIHTHSGHCIKTCSI